MYPQPCSRCGVPTFDLFGSQWFCLPCRRTFRAEIRARLRPVPIYADGVLRCDRCGTIVEEGGPNDYFELCCHGAHEERGTQAWRCNGWMRRVTVRELERLSAEVGGDAA